jgi:hypothetical protein
MDQDFEQILKLAYLSGYVRGKWDKLPDEIEVEDQISTMPHMHEGFITMIEEWDRLHLWLTGRAN